MANQEAWASGWAAGQGKKKGAKKDKPDAKNDGSSGGNGAWGTGWNSEAKPRSFKRGGKVRKSGTAKVHKGEIVLTAAQAKMCAGKPSKKKGARKRITSNKA